jgi:hypothetical protein
VIDGAFKIIFVKTKENKADIFTKNVSSGTYEENKDKSIRIIDYLKE